MRRALLLACLLCACGDVQQRRRHAIARGDLLVTVEATGSLRAVNTSAVTAPSLLDVWEFKIAWMAPESAEVKAGQPVVSFDPSELEQELERKRAEHESAAKAQEKEEVDLQMKLLQLDLEQAEADARLRRSKLKSDVPASQASRIEQAKVKLDLEQATQEVTALREKRDFTERSGRAEVDSLRHKAERAAQRVADLEQSIARLSVPAPRDGLVVYRTDWRGQKKKVGDAVGPWDRFLEIPDLSKMEAEAEIDEADAGRVAVGQRMLLRLESHPDREYGGSVTSIAPIVQRQSQKSALKVYKITLALDATDTERMRPGMRFRAEIEVDRKSGVLLAPLEAIVAGAGLPRVELPRTGGPESRTVELGARNRNMVEVRSGLKEGEEVELP